MTRTLLAVLAAFPILAAGGGEIALAKQPMSVKSAGGAPTAQIMRAYTKGSWEQYKSASGGTAKASDLPPTDCPPKPVQVCRDSWKPQTVNPFPSDKIKTVNPFE